MNLMKIYVTYKIYIKRERKEILKLKKKLKQYKYNIKNET